MNRLAQANSGQRALMAICDPMDESRDAIPAAFEPRKLRLLSPLCTAQRLGLLPGYTSSRGRFCSCDSHIPEDECNAPNSMRRLAKSDRGETEDKIPPRRDRLIERPRRNAGAQRCPGVDHQVKNAVPFIREELIQR